MIGALKGIIDTIADDHVILDVSGVGYTVFCNARLLSTLAPDEAVKLSIETQVREDHIHLYGFPDAMEREWFRLLLTVQRVGSRMALAILSALPPPALQQAILAQDTRAFARIGGVGPKLAERIVAELKDKAVKLPVGDDMPALSGSTLMPRPTASRALPSADEAISALINLGFTRTDAYAAAQKARTEIGVDAPVEQLIKISLKELARG